LLPTAGTDLLLVESMGLAACYSSVAQARDFSRRVTWGWQLPQLSEDLATVVSELVANALDHGLGLDVDASPAEQAAALASDHGAPWPIDLRLLRTPDQVVCVVSDPAPQPPRRLSPDLVHESGRGMQLIDSLSQRWGWALLARAGARGKAVWAALAVPVAG